MKKKLIGFWSTLSIVVGCVIGSGVFVKPGKVLIAAGGSTSAILAWVLGGLISLAGALTLAEIASRIPKSGGAYAYMEAIYGKRAGFVSGWVQTVIYGPALVAALALFFGSLATQFFGWDLSYQKPIALTVMFALALVGAIGTHYSTWIQNLSTVVKLIPIAVIALCGIWMGNDTIFGATVTPAATTQTSMGVAILATLWAYDGWIFAANLSDEVDNAEKTVPRALISGLLIVMAAYLLVNVSLFHVLPKDQIATLNERAVGVAAESMFGPIGGKLVSLGILISIFGCLNGNILASSRAPYAMAKADVFPFRNAIGSRHPKFDTPIASTVFVIALATVMIVQLNPDRITDVAIFSMYIVYTVLFFSLFRVRKEYGAPATGKYRTPLYPIVPLAAGIGSAYICYSMAIQSLQDAAGSILIALLGLPAYFILQRLKNKQDVAADPLPQNTLT